MRLGAQNHGDPAHRGGREAAVDVSDAVRRAPGARRREGTREEHLGRRARRHGAPAPRRAHDGRRAARVAGGRPRELPAGVRRRPAGGRSRRHDETSRAARRRPRGGGRAHSAPAAAADDAVHLVAGRLRPRLHLLRDGAHGPRAEPDAGRDLRASRARAARRGPRPQHAAAHQHRVHGHGRRRPQRRERQARGRGFDRRREVPHGAEQDHHLHRGALARLLPRALGRGRHARLVRALGRRRAPQEAGAVVEAHGRGAARGPTGRPGAAAGATTDPHARGHADPGRQRHAGGRADARGVRLAHRRRGAEGERRSDTGESHFARARLPEAVGRGARRLRRRREGGRAPGARGAARAARRRRGGRVRPAPHQSARAEGSPGGGC
mmetsp:Transcript_28272/g.84652  ORF Transcript_28272/g.84652 Transcript_28272/m.84652 type:complete len:382 (+) Transcript_28272:263-1408(+)